MKTAKSSSARTSFFKRGVKLVRPPWSQRTRIVGLLIIALVMVLAIITFMLTHSGDRSHTTVSKTSTTTPSVPKTPPATHAQPPSPSTPHVTSSSWWQPGTGVLPWQWVLSHSLNLANAQDAGTNSLTYQGDTAAKPVVYDIDGFNNTAEVVASIHAQNAHAICYIEVGAFENYRPDASAFPGAALGSSVPNYPDEKYLDITNDTVVSLIKARISMCHDKGFDAIEPDIDDSYGMNTGFSLSLTNEVQYLTNLANYAHSLGMAWGLKNGADAGDPQSFISAMLPSIDFAVVEEPFYLKTISNFYPALYNAGKAMFAAEYTNDTPNASSFCPAALANHVNTALFSVDLDASARIGCQ